MHVTLGKKTLTEHHPYINMIPLTTTQLMIFTIMHLSDVFK